MSARQLVSAGVILTSALRLAASVSAAPGTPEIWTVENMNDFQDFRLFTGDGDWRYGFSKTECGSMYPTTVGISAAPVINTFWDKSYFNTTGMLCANSDTILVDYWHGVSVWFGTGSHMRDTLFGDWAYGYDKAECANNEVLTGLAQQQEGINGFAAAQPQRYGRVLHFMQ